jgi:hypothetical protein
VDDPYLNLLWATTDASLGANTDANDTLSGFMARFLFFFPQRKKTKWLPLEEGTQTNSSFEGVVRNQLAEIAAKVASLPVCNPLHLSQDAADYYTEWQRLREEEWTSRGDGNAMQIYSRLAPTVVKLGMLFELGSPDFEVSRPIREEYVEEACRLVDTYFMPTAMAIYELVGANAEKNVIDRIIAYLKRHSGKATKKEIMRDVKVKSADFNDYLDTMIESDTIGIEVFKREGKGRDSVWIFLLDQSKVESVAKVARIAQVANVEEIQFDKDIFDLEDKDPTLATLATKATSSILTTDIREKADNDYSICDEPALPLSKPPKNLPYTSRIDRPTPTRSRHICRSCGKDFEIPLAIVCQGGYICEACRRDGPPPEPEKADQQSKLIGEGQA